MITQQATTLEAAYVEACKEYEKAKAEKLYLGYSEENQRRLENAKKAKDELAKRLGKLN